MFVLCPQRVGFCRTPDGNDRPGSETAHPDAIQPLEDMKRLFIAGVIVAGLSACGGGGNASTAPVAATPATPLSAYIGNWASSCHMHQIDSRTIARTPGTTDSISIAYQTDYYVNHDCTGAVIGTWTQSANVTAVYSGTVESSIVFTEGSAAVAHSVDKVIARLPQHTWLVTGTGVVHLVADGEAQWCIEYIDGDGSCIADSGTSPAAAFSLEALYLEGNALYELMWNGSSYSANEALNRQ